LRQLVRRAVVAAVVVIAAGLATVAPALAEEGRVRFAKPAQADLENAGIAENQAFIREHYWRVRSYGSSWSRYLGWFPQTWHYKNAYALYNPRAYPPGHVSEPNPDWILEDADGRKLFIPFDCDGRDCPQYAADIGNPDWRRHWIQDAKAAVARGNGGVFIDDVTMWPRVSDGDGDIVEPIDPRTGAPMSELAWARYMADFVAQVRSELPGVEIVHNILWYGSPLEGALSPHIKRQIASADHLEIERGYDDTHPGTSKWSWEACMRYVDYVHSQGKGIVADSYVDTREGAEYELATSLLVNEGRDSLSADWRDLPGDWWHGYDTDLGAAEGRRYAWNGGYRRDFQRGAVVVAPPGESVSGSLGGTFKDLDGRDRGSVSLSDKQGMVLLGAGAAGPSAPKPPAVVVQPRPNPPRSARDGKGPAKRKPPRSRRLRTRRLRRMRGAVLVRGEVRRARGGVVRLGLERKRRTGWRRTRSARVELGRGARFRRTFRGLRRGRYRVVAVYVGKSRDRSARRFVIRY
jgi:hypothetical protein